jgi:hypothetical protein
VGKFEQSKRFGPRHPMLAHMAFQAALLELSHKNSSTESCTPIRRLLRPHG